MGQDHFNLNDMMQKNQDQKQNEGEEEHEVEIKKNKHQNHTPSIRHNMIRNSDGSEN